MHLRQQAALLLGLLAVLFPALSSPAGVRADGEPPPLSFVCSDSDRFGVWHPPLYGIKAFEVEQLHASWYNSSTEVEDPEHPAGMWFAQLVRIGEGEAPSGVDAACYDAERPRACPTWDQVLRVAQFNPGSLWLIGNEPDRQDYVSPERYAEIYHDFYAFLKAADPTCQVGIGGVVQPTPIRLEYLDAILQTYQVQYGGAMPVDVWNVHSYVLREKKWYDGCPDCWGCDVPPGSPHDSGMLYGIQDHDNLGILAGHLTAMRAWMRDRGYRDRPLIVSEFGILMPEFYGYDHDRVRDFMLGAFEWMLTETSSDTGYPADGNRLVQAWSWFSLAQPTLEGLPIPSHLFDPATKAITALGAEFGAYTEPLTAPFPGSVDLRPMAVWNSLPMPKGGSPVTTTVTVQVQNRGAVPAEEVLVRMNRDDVPAGEATISNISPAEIETADFLWPDLIPGRVYRATVVVTAGGDVLECNLFNNARTTQLVIGNHWIHLPVVLR